MLERNRRAVLDGLFRILDSAGLEELFTGSDDEAAFLYDLLVEAARARSSTYYWEICRTARRRGVTPEFVVDRASVLLGAIKERRRTDLYRILGVPPLSSGEMIRQRWLTVAKTSHPDVGGDGGHFRRAKEAYEALRDPDRRADYERFWLRALGPFERIAPAEDREHLESARRVLRPAAIAPVDREVPAPEPRVEQAPLLAAAARLLAEQEALRQRLGLGPGVSVGSLLGPLETALAAVGHDEIDALRADVERGIAALGAFRARLGDIAMLKRRLNA